jgi:glucans biosynthesis protein C
MINMCETNPSSVSQTRSERVYYIDWLRIMAVFLLFFFHTARIFDPWENFYIQNAQKSLFIFDYFIWLIWPWQMSLFFFLAGASSYFALGFRSGKIYLNERCKRLLIPFIFGVLVLVPPQSYIGLISHSGSSISFLDWFPQFFSLRKEDMGGYFMGGHTWGHLWFIFHLFVYSIVAAPLFIYMRGASGKKFIDKLALLFTRPGIIYTIPVILAILRSLPEVVGGNPVYYITLFICGYIMMSDKRFSDTADRHKLIFLIAGPVLFSLLITGIFTGLLPGDNPPNWFKLTLGIYTGGFVPWFFIMALMSYGRRYLDFSNRFLKYFSEGSYPIYILHQSVIIIVGYFIVYLALPTGIKYSGITISSFAICIILYDVLIRRINVIRILFGMKLKAKK